MNAPRTPTIWFLSVLLCLSFAACGGDSGPLAGDWSQETADGKVGVGLTFDGHSDKVNVHLPPREDGTHGHEHGTYTLDAETMALTVRCKLLGKDSPEVWQGKVDGEHLDLAAGETELHFHRGGKHGH